MEAIMMANLYYNNNKVQPAFSISFTYLWI